MTAPLILNACLKTLNPSIQSVTKSPTFKKGAFTAKAKKAGYTAKQYMSVVLDDPHNFPEETRRQAQFMKTLMSFHK